MFARKIKYRSGSISYATEREKVAETYSHLCQIDKVFRFSPTDLRIRPIYHYRQRRIEAYICIASAAYAIYKKMLLKKRGVEMSA